MLKVQKFVVNMIEENCYVLSDESKEAVVIDCGILYPEEADAFRSYINDNELKVTHLINTHCHFDHIFGDGFIYKTYNILPEMSRNEVQLYKQLPKQLEMFLHRELPIIQPPVGRIFDAGETITFGTHKLDIIATPGHTPGGVCFYCEEERILFSGDSLFYHEIGRTDFPGGNYDNLISSLKNNILTLPEDVTVCPGHGDTTTVGEEKRQNPYLQ